MKNQKPKYSTTDEHGNCVFCKIATGEIMTPGIFWQDENYMAFLSTFPSTPGNTVVIPKNHMNSDVLSLPDDILQEFILKAKHVSTILLHHFDDVGRVGLIMEGTGINHAHIKLIPMHGTGYMKEGGWKQVLSEGSYNTEQYEGFLISKDGDAADRNELTQLAKQLSTGK